MKTPGDIAKVFAVAVWFIFAVCLGAIGAWFIRLMSWLEHVT